MLELIVLGQIPGTHTQLDFSDLIALAAIVALSITWITLRKRVLNRVEFYNVVSL